MTKRLLTTWLTVIIMCGCAAYQAKPIQPAQTASAFEARTLSNFELKKFMEANLHYELAPWPPESWDFTMLTLAAFYYHPEMDIARSQWDVAKAAIVTAGQRPNPTASFSPQYVTNSPSGVSPWVLAFALDIPIETAGKRGYRIAVAERLSEAARLNIASVAWRVRSRLRTSALSLYAANQAVSILRVQQAIQEETVKLMNERLAAGEVSQPDVVFSQISLDKTRLSFREEQKVNAEARVELANALGLPAAALDGVNISFGFLEQIPSTENFPAGEIRRYAFLNRTDILTALAEYDATQSALRLEIARQYPDIVLGPGYEFDQDENKWGFGLSAMLPIFNQNQGPIAEAEARRKEAEARFVALQSGVMGEIDQALASYDSAVKKLETADAAATAERDLEESVKAKFEHGEVDRLTLLGAQLELQSSILSRLRALIEAQQALGSLEDAVQRPLSAAEDLKGIGFEKNPREMEESKQ